MKILGKILGVVLIFVAFYSLDLQSWNQIIISILLSLSGFSLLLKDSKSESAKSLSKFLLRTAFVLAVLFILKRLITG